MSQDASLQTEAVIRRILEQGEAEDLNPGFVAASLAWAREFPVVNVLFAFQRFAAERKWDLERVSPIFITEIAARKPPP